jgi:hypothetical protein
MKSFIEMLGSRASPNLILLFYYSSSQVKTLRRVLRERVLSADGLPFCGGAITPTAGRVQNVFEVNEQVAQIIHFS